MGEGVVSLFILLKERKKDESDKNSREQGREELSLYFKHKLEREKEIPSKSEREVEKRGEKGAKNEGRKEGEERRNKGRLSQDGNCNLNKKNNNKTERRD